MIFRSRIYAVTEEQLLKSEMAHFEYGVRAHSDESGRNASMMAEKSRYLPMAIEKAEIAQALFEMLGAIDSLASAMRRKVELEPYVKTLDGLYENFILKQRDAQ